IASGRLMKLIIQNLAIEYEDRKEGSASSAGKPASSADRETILFLHGWQSDMRTFDGLAASLASGRRIVRLDLPGFGKSERPKKPWNLGDYVQFVKDFIQKIEINPDILIGHSFGGRIILKGEGEGILKAQKNILIGAAGVSQRNKARNTFLKVLAKIFGLVFYIPPLIFWREKIRRKLYDAIGSGYYNAGTLKESFVKIISEDLSEQAKKIPAPTLLIWGREDSETPLSDGQKLSHLLLQSKLLVFDGGHFIHQEKSKEVIQVIKEFI
ncbi:MAG: alpha/beta hydrolase, partial [Candidatus Colwellbacteria bacterium]|nr:alpha/beta hydrolase [Candidatus Colwellbacteria bacterium]